MLKFRDYYGGEQTVLNNQKHFSYCFVKNLLDLDYDNYVRSASYEAEKVRLPIAKKQESLYSETLR